MYFNDYPWDLVKKMPELGASTGNNFYAIAVTGPFLSNFFIKLLLDSFPNDSTNKSWKIKPSKELNLPWLQENLFSFDLFGEQKPILITSADEIPSSFHDFFLTLDQSQLATKLVLSFDHETSLFKKLTQQSQTQSLLIKDTPFWEMKKLFLFLCEQKKVKLSSHAIEFLLSHINHSVDDFFTVIEKIEQNFYLQVLNGTLIEKEDLKTSIEFSKFDLFELAEDFNRQRLMIFFQKIIALNLDNDELSKLSSFMLAHIFKLMDPSVVQEKKKLSQYDKALLESAKQWKSESLIAYADFFSEIEIIVRAKGNLDAQNKIKQKLLESLSLTQ
jgi:hypothetical protein